VVPRAEPLSFYGQPGDQERLPWAWAESRLVDATTYWVVTPSRSHPHPRPVWGVWHQGAVHLSVGTPALRRSFASGAPVTVHLDDGLDVVILEGAVRGPTSDRDVVAAYDTKYSWEYDLAQYGPFTSVTPARVLAWRAAGAQGRDGVVQATRFRFDDA